MAQINLTLNHEEIVSIRKKHLISPRDDMLPLEPTS